MKEIETTRHFEKDLKKFGLSAGLIDVLNHLINGIGLPEKYKDHALSGDMKEFRDCHVKPDLVLIYKIVENRVVLYRLNTHSELFK